MAGRILVRDWKDKRSGFTRRMLWYAASYQDYGNDIRLVLEDAAVGRHNHFPKTKESAEQLWQDFKLGKIDIYGKSHV